MASRSSPRTDTWPESERELSRVGPAPGETGGAAAAGELDGPLDLPARAEAVGEPGGEAVAASVRVADGTRQGRGPPRSALTRLGLPLSSVRSRSPDDDARWRMEVPGPVLLARVAAAGNKRVELHARLCESVKPARGGHECTRPAGLPDGLHVAGREVDRIGVVQRVPGERVGPSRAEPRPQDGDGALAMVVQVHERAALRLGPEVAFDVDAELGQLSVRPVSEVVA